MSEVKLLPVILCGGSGTRLWPVSREKFPKQFTSINGRFTMLQETALRFDNSIFDPPLILSHEANRFLVQAQLEDINLTTSGIMLEPVARNTAPAITSAAVWAIENQSNPIMIISPSDHVISDQKAFEKSLESAIILAKAGKVVTMGVRPTYAETGYGYILKGDHFKVKSFCEKPDLQTAEKYLESGNYLWNSGVLVVQATTLIREMEKHQPKIVQLAREAYADGAKDLNFFRLHTPAFNAMPSISMDYAMLEKTRLASVVLLDAGWSDVGSWKAIHDLKEKDLQDNVLQGDVVAKDTENTLVYGQNRLITTLGVKDLIIVDTEDALMVAHKDSAQSVKDITKALKDKQRSETEYHRRVYRPWGYFESLQQGPGFQVKRLLVKSGESLSLQLHHHRSEHWVIVQGYAKVTRDDETILMHQNESTFIPVGTKHRLENPGKEDLVVIEVQTGIYLGEDDIVRFEDIYSRPTVKVSAQI